MFILIYWCIIRLLLYIIRLLLCIINYYGISRVVIEIYDSHLLEHVLLYKLSNNYFP